MDHADERVGGWCVRSLPCGGAAEAAVAWDRPRMLVRPLDAALGIPVPPSSALLEAASLG